MPRCESDKIKYSQILIRYLMLIVQIPDYRQISASLNLLQCATQMTNILNSNIPDPHWGPWLGMFSILYWGRADSRLLSAHFKKGNIYATLRKNASRSLRAAPRILVLGISTGCASLLTLNICCWLGPAREITAYQLMKSPEEGLLTGPGHREGHNSFDTLFLLNQPTNALQWIISLIPKT